MLLEGRRDFATEVERRSSGLPGLHAGIDESPRLLNSGISSKQTARRFGFDSQGADRVRGFEAILDTV